jgi:putative ABC transport system permease protein
MVKTASVKDFLREIKKTFSRFLSIILLLILSVGFFSGLRVTKPDMQQTADSYMDKYDMYDLRVISTLGLTDSDIEAMSQLPGVSKAAGLRQFDAVAASSKQDIVISISTLNASGMNSAELLTGRLPQTPGECAAETRLLEMMGLNVGDDFTIKELPPSFQDALQNKTLKIVGTVRTPVYMSKVQRGSSTLGSGSVAAYVIVPEGAVSLDYYTEADLTVGAAFDETAFTDAYKNAVTPVSDSLKALGDTRAPVRTDEIVSKATAELNDAKAELNDKKAELSDAEQQLEDGRRGLADGQKKLDEEKATADRELAAALDKLESAKADIASGSESLRTRQAELDAQKTTGENQLQSALNDLNGKQSALDEAFAAYSTARTALDAQLLTWNALPVDVRQTMPDKAKELEEAQQQLDAQKQALDAQHAALTAGLNELAAQKTALEQQLADAQAQLDAGAKSLQEARAQYDAGLEEYERQKTDADKQLADAQAQLDDAAREIADSAAKLAEGMEKIAQGEADVKDAEAKIADIKPCQWYVEDRSANLGYDSFRQDADRMGALGNVFPILFFAVAVLVCLTTMTRMVDEKRSEIGAYKALGHSRMTTAGKFVYYSLVAAVLGVTGGLAFGTLLFPQFIFKAYSIMYSLPPLQTPVQLGVCAISAAVALLCTVGATVAASVASLRETPASLLLPKAPEPGKRVLLEYITPLWNRMSFFAKVSARNIFRYKKRLFMTLFGIAGCTALIVTGFGLRDSILNIADKQFGELFKYDLQVVMTEQPPLEDIASTLRNDANVADYLFEESTTADAVNSSGIQSVHVVVPEDAATLTGFITLRHRSDWSAVRLPDDGAVITEKFAQLLDLTIGDTFIIDSDGRHTVEVADITENYVYHYVYMSPDYYRRVFGRDMSPNQLLIQLRDASVDSADTVSATLLKESGVAYVAHFKSIAKSFRDSMNSVNAVVVIILVSAGLLALVVLYNLTNINITERARELATIKVLGFYDREVSWYIFRENTILTVIGVLVGLLGGKLLHGWLVKTIELSFVMFGREAKPLSYVFAALLTAAFAVAVNIIGHRHMKRINMVESLKTNE